jgi:hypothetical protein
MEFVTDRTEADALLGNDKGVYSYTDLNRVESGVNALSALLPSLDMNLNLETKTDWGYPGSFSVGEWPTATQMQRYLKNVSDIKSVFGISLWLPPDMSKLTWSSANNIEKILERAMTSATNTIQAFRYSGEIYSGEA